MENKEIIEEFAKDIGIAFQLAGTTRFSAVAEILAEKYQPKLSENTVVLTKEEQDKILQATEYRINQLRRQIAVKENDIGKLESEIDDLKYELKQTRKEMAREVLKAVYDRFEEKTEYESVSVVLEELAEECGVEIKE